jgi:hypothetical protein
MQADLNNSYKNTLATETYSTTGAYNYTWSSLQGVPSTTVLQVNYYDNYNFRTNLPYFYDSNYAYTTPAGFEDKRYGTDADVVKSKGLLTGTITAMLDNTGFEFRTVYYYDDRGRMIQSIAENYADGFDKEYTNYSFTGKPVWKQMIHTSFYTHPGGNITETYTYSYDHADRLTTTKYKLDDEPEFTLSTLSYDNQGRLAGKIQSGTAATTSYSYNIRNWTTGISANYTTDTIFDEKMYYNESYAGNTPQYNGNISAVSWHYLVNNNIQGYTYIYDGLNRLKKGQYLSGTTIDDSFTEEISQYDKNGNIKKLKRHARISGAPNIASIVVDDLTLDYTGNQITGISDAVPSSTSTIGFAIPNTALDGSPVLYNSNGAMKQNFYNGIAGITYNVLNLPEKIQFMDGHSTRYRYDASGTKHTVTYTTVRSNLNIPLGTTTYSPGSEDVQSSFFINYCGNGHIVFENHSLLKWILNPEGYTEKQSDGTYRYY